MFLFICDLPQITVNDICWLLLQLLGQFIARCVADDCLPPKFITSYKGKVDSGFVK